MSDELSRRQLLGTAVTGLVESADDKAPGKQVEDRTTNLKITRLRALPAGTKAYIKIETNLDITGWGEVTGSEPKVACVLAESLYELLDTENPILLGIVDKTSLLQTYVRLSESF